jgi:hypothetical protein
MATPKSSHVDRNFNYKPSSLRYRTIFGKEIAISLGWYSKNFDALFLRTAARYAHKNPTFFLQQNTWNYTLPVGYPSTSVPTTHRAKPISGSEFQAKHCQISSTTSRPPVTWLGDMEASSQHFAGRVPRHCR